MRELINENELPPLPAMILGTDNMSLQMSVVLVMMGMMMYAATFTIELIGYASRLYQQMQVFTAGFGLLLTTLGIIANQFAVDLVLAARVLALIMLMSECFLGLMFLLARYNRLTHSARHYGQPERVTVYENVQPVRYIPDFGTPVYGRITNNVQTRHSDSYPYRFVPQEAAVQHEVVMPKSMFVSSSAPVSVRSSMTEPQQSERISIRTVESVFEPTESPARPANAPPPSPTPDELIAAALRRAARKAFRLDPSPMCQSAGQATHEPVSSTSDHQPSAEPFLPVGSNQPRVTRPNTLNLPKPTFRWPVVCASSIVPSVSRAMQGKVAAEPDSTCPNYEAPKLARRPSPTGEQMYRNSEPMPSTSRQEPAVGNDIDPNYVTMRRCSNTTVSTNPSPKMINKKTH